jgi:hypothetical protein
VQGRRYSEFPESPNPFGFNFTDVRSDKCGASAAIWPSPFDANVAEAQKTRLNKNDT